MVAGMSFSESSLVAVSRDQVSCDLAGEAAILSLKNGTYYGLDPVGARIWSLMQQPVRFGALRDQIVSEFDVEPERCESDLAALLHRLKSEGLIEVTA
jgi:hypothetical protein